MKACPSRLRSLGLAAVAGAVLVLARSTPAAAESDRVEPSPATTDRVQAAARAGQFLPLTLSPSVGPSSALAAGLGGYDSAARAPLVESFAEARVFGPLALRFGIDWRGNQDHAASIAGRVQVLSQASHGVDGAVSLAYKAEGFSEPEGELELVVAVARSFGSCRLFGNVAYGQDPEGRERDGEVRAAALFRLSALYYVGIDGRGRFDPGFDRAAPNQHDEPAYDLDIGPVLNVALGPLALSAHFGVAANRRPDGAARLGAVGLAGLGAAL